MFWVLALLGLGFVFGAFCMFVLVALGRSCFAFNHPGHDGRLHAKPLPEFEALDAAEIMSIDTAKRLLFDVIVELERVKQRSLPERLQAQTR